MSEDNNVNVKLDLDAKQFTEKLQHANHLVSEMVSAEKFEELFSAFKKVGVVAGVVTGAVLAVKAALDFTIEGEKIKSIENNFRVLSNQVGVSANEMKEGLETAAQGLVDSTDLLEIANAQIVKFGESADRLPEVLELSRKSAVLTGQEIGDTFERMSTAIANGNTRMLKQMGIVVDTDAALKNYALTHGVLIKNLTDAEKRQAILNAAIDAGKKSLGQVDESAKQATNSWQQIKVGLHDIGELFVRVFEKVIGPAVRAATKEIAKLVTGLKASLEGVFGDGTVEAQIDSLNKKILEHEATLKVTEKSLNEFRAASGENAEETKQMQYYYDASIAKLNEYYEQLAALKKQKDSPSSGASNISSAEVDARREQALKLDEDLSAIRAKRFEAEMKNSTDLTELDEAYYNRLIEVDNAAVAQMAVINDQVAQGKLERAMADEQIALAEQTRLTETRNLQKMYEDERINALQRIADLNANTAQGFADGWNASAAKAGKDMGNFSKLGSVAMNAFQKSTTNAFVALGEGSVSAADAMKGAMFGALADIAQSQGEIMIAQGFAGNFAAAAAGAGLLILSGFLRSQAKTSSGGSIPSASGGSSGGGFASQTASDQVEKHEAPRKSVTVAVQGNYFETEQTKTRLLEMIREGTDATDFKYQQIGG